MTREQRIGLLVGILALVLVGLCLASCQTMAGACRDIESAARYGREHMLVEE